jgi:uncharacterized protein YeaO (DUF488 family)
MSKRIVAENIKLKRAYDSPSSGDGIRILIDRLWPRGVKKADAAIDLWAKDIAPSTALRKWFGHDPARWHKFRSRYSDEIHRNPGRLGEIRSLAQRGRITLIFAAQDEAHSDAGVLREILLGRSIPRESPTGSSSL